MGTICQKINLRWNEMKLCHVMFGVFASVCPELISAII